MNEERNEEKNKVDRRIVRTRQALRQTLMELIREKGYETVSVEEIVQRADVARATFYLHYRDKEDLLLDEFNQLAQERVRELAQVSFAVWMPQNGQLETVNENLPTPPFRMIFQHAADHAELYRILLRNPNSNRLAVRIREIVDKSIHDFVEERMLQNPVPVRFGMPVELLAAYFNGALMSSIDWWLDHMKEYSVDEMTLLFQRMFFPGARSMLKFE